MLALLNAVVPGSAERMFNLYEDQARHRMNLEQRVVASDIRQSERGQNWGGAIAMTGLLVAGAVAWGGHEVAAAAIGGGSLATLVGAFVVSFTRRRDELAQKRANAPPATARPRK